MNRTTDVASHADIAVVANNAVGSKYSFAIDNVVVSDCGRSIHAGELVDVVASSNLGSGFDISGGINQVCALKAKQIDLLNELFLTARSPTATMYL